MKVFPVVWKIFLLKHAQNFPRKNLYFQEKIYSQFLEFLICYFYKNNDRSKIVIIFFCNCFIKQMPIFGPAKFYSKMIKVANFMKSGEGG